MENININLVNLNYSLDGYRWYPLPYGKIYVKNARLFGKVYSSYGGGWKWNLPKKCIIGYGKYNPYAEFYFTGNLHIDSKKNVCYDYYLKIFNLRYRWLYFDGQFKSSKLWKVESILKSLNLDKWVWYTSQGNLEVWFAKLNYKLIDIMDIITNVNGRRKIFNHQFFGYCRIYYIGNSDGNYNFVVIVKDTTKVVSPNHLEKPFELKKGIYLASHPEPILEGVD